MKKTNKPSKIKYTGEDIAVTFICYCEVILCALCTLIPIINLISKAVSEQWAVTAGKVGILPVGFQLNTMKYVVSSKDFLMSFKNSFIVTVIGTLLGVFVTGMTAYPLSKKNLSGIKPILLFFVFTMLFSGGLVPTYLLMRQLKLYNTLWALILPGIINVYNMLIIKNYYESLPDSIEESARIDGANNFIIFIRIIIPLSAPVFATIALFDMVALWNDYFNPLMYITDFKLKTLQLYLSSLISEAQMDLSEASVDDLMNSSQEGIRAATIVAATVPIICIYPFLQKYFIKGILIGSVKG